MYYKAVVYGDNLDLYNYEEDIRTLGGKRKTVQSSIGLSDMDTSSLVVRERQLQKRRDNARRAQLSFRRLILSNMGDGAPPILITNTYTKNQANARIGYKDFKAFIGKLRYLYGAQFRYISVPEFQKRGALHFHTLFWGLPEDLPKKERSTRLVASLWGLGFTDVYLTDGNEKIAFYLSKYMSKNFSDSRFFGIKCYRTSRNVIRPITLRNLGGTWYLSEKYGIGVDNPPCIDKSFQTQWLGKGRYRLYKNIIHNK